MLTFVYELHLHEVSISSPPLRTKSNKNCLTEAVQESLKPSVADSFFETMPIPLLRKLLFERLGVGRILIDACDANCPFLSSRFN